MPRHQPASATPPPPAEASFPGPFSALALTLAAAFASVLVASIIGSAPRIAALGIGEAIGFGGVATLAARHVPEPRAERLGLRGFEARLALPLLALLPVVMLLSELDNWLRVLAPPSEQLAELARRVHELNPPDSVYAGLEAVIVDVGITPVVESFLFFAVLLQGLVARMGRIRGVLLTSVLFALVHFPVTGEPTDAIMPLISSLVIGATLALARLASGSLLAPILLAASLAGLGLLARALAEVLPIAGFNAAGAHTPSAIVLPCAVVFALGARALARRAVATPFGGATPELPLGDEGEGRGAL